MKPWPALPFEEWKETLATLHMLTQIVGKVRLASTPLVNHWWNAPLYVTIRGLATGPFPSGDAYFDLGFDFMRHTLCITRDDGCEQYVPLVSQSVATFYDLFRTRAESMGLHVDINPLPCEVPNPIAFDRDEVHRTYVAEQAHRFWQALLECDRVFHEFRARFVGKCSPVHFFWGSFDLAVTRFSGRPAPPRDGADAVTREAYSHEVISHGFWPGSEAYPHAAFYAYCAPDVAGFRDAMVAPGGWDSALGEYVLPYDAVRAAADPDETLMRFLQQTYEAGATKAAWPRELLERKS